jgi:hypothetical protein
MFEAEFFLPLAGPVHEFYKLRENYACTIFRRPISHTKEEAAFKSNPESSTCSLLLVDYLLSSGELVALACFPPGSRDL